MIVGSFNMHYANFEAKISCLTQFMSYLRVPQRLRSRILNYYYYLWSRQRGLAQSEIVDQLPLPFRKETNLIVAYHVLAECPLFVDCDLGFMYAVAGALQLQLYAPVDVVCRVGEIGHELFFIHRGTVEVYLPLRDGDQVFTKLGQAQFFGENSFFFAERRNASIRARTHCDIFLLTADAYAQVLENYPKYDAKLRAVAARYKKQRSSPHARRAEGSSASPPGPSPLGRRPDGGSRAPPTPPREEGDAATRRSGEEQAAREQREQKGANGGGRRAPDPPPRRSVTVAAV